MNYKPKNVLRYKPKDSAYHDLDVTSDSWGNCYSFINVSSYKHQNSSTFIFEQTEGRRDFSIKLTGSELNLYS